MDVGPSPVADGEVRDEVLNDAVRDTLTEAQIIIGSWRRHDNTIRPRGGLGDKPRAPEVLVPAMIAQL